MSTLHPNVDDHSAGRPGWLRRHPWRSAGILVVVLLLGAVSTVLLSPTRSVVTIPVPEIRVRGRRALVELLLGARTLRIDVEIAATDRDLRLASRRATVTVPAGSSARLVADLLVSATARDERTVLLKPRGQLRYHGDSGITVSRKRHIWPIPEHVELRDDHLLVDDEVGSLLLRAILLALLDVPDAAAQASAATRLPDVIRIHHAHAEIDGAAVTKALRDQVTLSGPVFLDVEQASTIEGALRVERLHVTVPALTIPVRNDPDGLAIMEPNIVFSGSALLSDELLVVDQATVQISLHEEILRVLPGLVPDHVDAGKGVTVHRITVEAPVITGDRIDLRIRGRVRHWVGRNTVRVNGSVRLVYDPGGDGTLAEAVFRLVEPQLNRIAISNFPRWAERALLPVFQRQVERQARRKKIALPRRLRRQEAARWFWINDLTFAHDPESTSLILHLDGHARVPLR